ncbi:MAG: choice-of-anchor Q domain-containing protein, partial [Rhodanobacteraceae bacterium]
NVASSSNAVGGGVYARNGLHVLDSTISYNSATGPGYAQGGGFHANGTISIYGSTISGNDADSTGGGFVAGYISGLRVSNSTISGNRAGEVAGAMVHATTSTVVESTIAWNVSRYGSRASGMYFSDVHYLRSSIFAYNTSPDGPNDVTSQSDVIDGSHNLINATTNSVPLDTIHGCPKLGPLANNGGSTLTHAIGNGSPAMNAGVAYEANDQRGVGFPRVIGPAADIGSYENQGGIHDSIFHNNFDVNCS